MTSTKISRAGRAAGPEAAEAPRTEALAGPFVLNLCSSTTPLALAQVDLPELKRFEFFVSRRFEEGRERFRLHMGYFATLAEAEEWLSVVREVYPGAWAGESPGRKLRERAAALAKQQQDAAAKSAAPAAAPPVLPVAQPAPARPAPASTGPTAQPAGRAPVPTLRPASNPAPASAAPAAAAAPVPPTLQAATVAPGAASPRQAAAPAAAGAPRASSRVPAPPQAPKSGQKPAVQPPSSTARARPPAVFSQSNVREVLAALDSTEEGEGTRVMPAEARPAPPAADTRPAPPAAGTRPGASESEKTLSDTQVLRFLELRRDPETQPVEVSGESNISLLKPDDTGTRRALRQAVTQNDGVYFAVQLHWSVQPVDVDKVPPLAIFSAYTLYTVDGSRDGRKWYGLRLGFFKDAISAKQVAHYVRSEFASVAVVPVSPQEKSRASEHEPGIERKSPSGSDRAATGEVVEEFKLLDDDQPRRYGADPTAAAPVGSPAPASSAPAPAPAATRAAPVAAPKRAAPAPGAPAGRRPGPRRRRAGEVNANERRTPQTLEETLEILGASQLQIDEGSGETLNDSGVRHLRVQVQKNAPFSKLLERLSDRIRKP